jgi:hypothetical protein
MTVARAVLAAPVTMTDTVMATAAVTKTMCRYALPASVWEQAAPAPTVGLIAPSA